MKPTYAEQIVAEIARSRKQRVSARLFYYTEAYERAEDELNQILCSRIA
jgi:hypothetical protein